MLVGSKHGRGARDTGKLLTNLNRFEENYVCQSTTVIRPRDHSPGDRGQLEKAQSITHVEEPGHVRDRGRGGADDVRPLHYRPLRKKLRPADFHLALVHRDLRELRRSHGRRTRQGPGGHAAQEPHQKHRPQADAQREDGNRSRRVPAKRGHLYCRCPRGDSRRRRNHRGRCQRR